MVILVFLVIGTLIGLSIGILTSAYLIADDAQTFLGNTLNVRVWFWAIIIITIIYTLMYFLSALF